jgi:hydrogenase nickel incorporation protein HypA/HybF
MHELSIALSIVDAVTDSAAAYPGARVKQVRLRVGVVSAVVEDSLRFCWEVATSGSALEGAELAVTMLPVVVHCAACNASSEIESFPNLVCPHCGRPSNDLRQGRELEIEAMEIEMPQAMRLEAAEEQT